MALALELLGDIAARLGGFNSRVERLELMMETLLGVEKRTADGVQRIEGQLMTISEEVKVLRQLFADLVRETDALAVRQQAQNVRLAGLRQQLTDLQAQGADTTAAASELEQIITDGQALSNRLTVLGQDPGNPIPGGVGSMDAPGVAPPPAAASGPTSAEGSGAAQGAAAPLPTGSTA